MNSPGGMAESPANADHVLISTTTDPRTGSEDVASTSAAESGMLSGRFWSDASPLSSSSSSSSSPSSLSLEKKKTEATPRKCHPEDARSSLSSESSEKKNTTCKATPGTFHPDDACRSKQKVSIRILHPNDVLYGRGHSRISHPGNITFHTFVSERKEEYMLSQTRQEKTNIIREVFARLKQLDPPARFLEKSACVQASGWVKVSDSRALQKISQALREYRKKMTRSSKKEKQIEVASTAPVSTIIAAPSPSMAPISVTDAKGTHDDVFPVHVNELTPEQLKEEADRVMYKFGLKSLHGHPKPYWAKG